MRFKIHNIAQERLGEKLRNARLSLNLGLGEIEKKIKINKKYLEAIENGEYQKLPGEVYVKNFLKIYSNFLNLDFNEILQSYEKEKVFNFQPAKIKKEKRFISYQFFKKIIFLIVIFFLIFYLFFEIKKLLFLPSLTIISPNDNIITKESRIKVIGRADEEAEIKINDTLVSLNIKGNFEENIELKPGLNLIKISASKKKGKEKIIYRKVILSE